MKVILTGATGFIGGEVLRQLLQSPAISLITVITRRPLPDELGSPKIRQVICKEEFEWLEWGPSMMRWVDGSEACIWYGSRANFPLLTIVIILTSIARCIGGLPKSSSSSAAYVTTTTTLPLAAAQAFSPLATFERKFRFIYLSTYQADVTESKWRPFEKKSAYLNGRTERALFELTKNHPLQVQYELYTFRPGSVLDWMGQVSENGFCGKVGRLWVPTVPVRVLAKAMVDVSFFNVGSGMGFGG